MDTSLVQNIGSKLATAGSKMLFKVKKISPEILIGVGIVSIGAGTVLACKATLKADAVLDEHANKMFAIEEAKEKFPDSYSDKDELQDKVTTYTQTGVGFAKLYWPSIRVGGACQTKFIFQTNWQKLRMPKKQQKHWKKKEEVNFFGV